MSVFNPDDGVLLTPAEMGLADRATVAIGISGIDLMEAAGKAVASAVQSRWSRQPVSVLCGPGGNGGDGFVAARHLRDSGWPVRLTLLGSRSDLSGGAAHHAALWKGTVEPFSTKVLDEAGIVIDAIFGAGLSHAVDGTVREMIEALKTRKTAICAVDVPSGLDGATGEVRGAAAAAEMTVTFFRKKPGHVLFPGRLLCGAIVLADIGIPATVLCAIAPRTFENGPALWQSTYPWPRAEGHKFERGEALVLGGEAVTGASRLTASAALRIGAGLVTLAAPSAVWPIYASSLTGVIVRALSKEGAFDALLSDKRRNAIAIGPGAGIGDDTRQRALAALATKRAVVLDADALTSFSSHRDLLFQAIQGPCVLTPHTGEFSRLFDAEGDKLTRTRRAAQLSGAVVLLKGGDTVIAEPGGLAIINSNAPPTLATAGSGDVLTGFVVGLLAQGLSPFHSAAAAAWLHGEAATAFGPGLVASDLPDLLPGVLRRLKHSMPDEGDDRVRNGTEDAEEPA
ncbi:bifunctional ADP-dependent NAD(P)H-hydrate dehydratase/NAD(P)H-hydrate epimerase [soil metagenome]